jgi:ribosome-binding protein aMBF1 (putative translation factor)
MKINCEICGKMVAEIEPGSRIRKGTVCLCRQCAEDYGFSEKPQNDAPQDNNIVNELNKIFGGFK